MRDVDYDRVYRDSFLRVVGQSTHGDDFFARFYERFLSTSPEVRDKFRDTDFSVQREMLRRSLTHVERFSVYRRADEAMRRIADRHARSDLDIEPYLYDIWLDSLVETVRELDPEFEDDVEIAWRVQLAAGIAYMKQRHPR